MKIEKHGNLYRVVKMINYKRHRLSFDHKPTKDEIERAVAEIRMARPTTNCAMTFQEALQDYIDMNSNILSPNTIRNYRGGLKALPETFRNTQISKIDKPMIQRIINQYTLDHSPKTVANLNGIISLVLINYGDVRFNIKLPQKSKTERYLPTEEDITRILEHISGTEFEVPFMLGAFAGLRRGEIAALTVSDCKNCKVHVTKDIYWNAENKTWDIKPYPKNTSSIRYVDIPQVLQDKINKKGYIYAHVPNRMWKDLDKACKELAITPFPFHQLRHYYASACHALNIPDKYIQKNGGWSTDKVLKSVYQSIMTDKEKAFNEQITDHFSSLIK